MSEPYRTTIDIAAPPTVVYPYLTDPESMLRWMGEYALLDARPGGEFTVDINGVPIRGRYLEVEPPRRVVISWGHAGSEQFRPGCSTVEIVLETHNGGTRLHLEHRDLPPDLVRVHGIGWSFFLPRLMIAGAGGNAGKPVYPSFA